VSSDGVTYRYDAGTGAVIADDGFARVTIGHVRRSRGRLKAVARGRVIARGDRADWLVANLIEKWESYGIQRCGDRRIPKRRS